MPTPSNYRNAFGTWVQNILQYKIFKKEGALSMLKGRLFCV
jgi:hypothetical protein